MGNQSGKYCRHHCKPYLQHTVSCSNFFCLAINISIRHDFLYNSIGYLDKEQEAYENVWIISALSLTFVLLSTLMETWLFIVYNQKCHPFKDIIVGIETENDDKQSIP